MTRKVGEFNYRRPVGTLMLMIFEPQRWDWQLSTWRRGVELDLINEVTLHWARLVPGWVTICGQVNHLSV